MEGGRWAGRALGRGPGPGPGPWGGALVTQPQRTVGRGGDSGTRELGSLGQSWPQTATLLQARSREVPRWSHAGLDSTGVTPFTGLQEAREPLFQLEGRRKQRRDHIQQARQTRVSLLVGWWRFPHKMMACGAQDGGRPALMVSHGNSLQIIMKRMKLNIRFGTVYFLRPRHKSSSIRQLLHGSLCKLAQVVLIGQLVSKFI